MLDGWQADIRQAWFKGNGVAKRLLVAVVAFSSLITAVITGVELHGHYRRDLREIDQAFAFVETSYVPSLTHGVWQYDSHAVQTQLEGLLRLPDVEYAAIVVDGRTRWSVGQRSASRQRAVDLPLVQDPAGRRQQIGTLQVVASVDRVIARVWQDLITELLANALKTLLVAGFLLVVFQHLVTRHLGRVAQFMNTLGPASLHGSTVPQLTLDRPPTGRWRPDILDTMTSAINRLLRALQHAETQAEVVQSRLAESELRFRLGTEASGAGLWDCDLVRRRFYASADCARLAGLEPVPLQEGLGFWRARVHPLDQRTVHQAIRRHLSGQSPLLRMEFRLKNDELGWRWMVLRGSIVERAADGRPLRAIGTLMDVEDRKRAEAAMRTSQARLQALTEHSAALIWEIGEDGRICFTNRRGPDRPAVGQLAIEWFPPAQRGEFIQHLHHALRGERRSLEVMIPRPSGPPRHYLVTVSPIPGEGDKRTVALTALDVTELKQVEQATRDLARDLERRVRERTAALEAARDEAERASRAKSEFLSRMSHELRTPMNAILGFAQILQMTEPSRGQQRWVDEIRHAGEHLRELIDELLDLARIEVGKLKVRIAPVLLQPLVHEAVALVEAARATRDIKLDVQELPQAMAVLADGTRLRQVLVNLLSNAIKYNRDGGRVELRLQPLDDQRLRLSVTDTGNGIPTHKLDSLFQPFERLGREDTDIEGMGIGLSLSRRLAELMDCALGVRSIEGEGSTFWIDMPLAPADVPVEPPAAPAAVPATARRLRLLYVEDNEVNVVVMQAYFEQMPHVQLLTACDGPSGIALARREQPDVVLLDIQLPDMDGYAVLKALKAHVATRDIPVVAVSADAMPHDLERGMAAGFAGYVAKPIAFADLVRVIEEVTA